MSASSSPSLERVLSPNPDDVAVHERTAVSEFVDVARQLVQDLRQEKQRRKFQRDNRDPPANNAQTAVQRTAWFQNAATDVLRRVRVIQNLSQSLTDWNMCAEERMRREDANAQASHLEDQVAALVNERRIELEAGWAQERSEMAAELARVKAALWEQTVAADSESASRSPRHGSQAEVSPPVPKRKMNFQGRSRALGRLSNRAAAEFVKPFVTSWRSKVKLEEMISPRSHAQNLGVLVSRGPRDKPPLPPEASTRGVPTELSGVVGKCGNTLTSRWVARFVTLDSRCMKIFVDQSRAQIKTNIPLHHVAGVRPHDKRAFAIKIKLNDGRSFFLGLQNEGMRKEWIAAIELHLGMPDPSPRHSPRHLEQPSPRHMV